MEELIATISDSAFAYATDREEVHEIARRVLGGKGYQIEKRAIGNDDVANAFAVVRICTGRAESMAGRNLVKLIKDVLLSGLALVLGLPHQSTLAPPDSAWLKRKDHLGVSKMPEAIIKGLLPSALDMKKRLVGALTGAGIRSGLSALVAVHIFYISQKETQYVCYTHSCSAKKILTRHARWP